jgi:hypothetical protein
LEEYRRILCPVRYIQQREWVPQYWGLICNGRAVFRNMGAEPLTVMALRKEDAGLSDPLFWIPWVSYVN